MHFYCYITLIITGIDTSSSDRVQRLQNWFYLFNIPINWIFKSRHISMHETFVLNISKFGQVIHVNIPQTDSMNLAITPNALDQTKYLFIESN